ncbi:vacuolar sorting protein VPS33/slp1 [Gaertneriomyces sp. JEL0708]|nr:vacuolar sorting protein VPS33/slp1 [Gaertneriomyces sp. JEL0708]
MASLKDVIKKRILIDMIRSVDPPSRWKIIVVDSKTIKILNTAVKMHEILEENVTLVEDLTRKRQAYPTKEAIYFITPTEDCVGMLIEDFRRQPMYAAAHVFFTAGLPDELFNRITSSPAKPFVKKLIEMNIDFMAYEPQVFTFDQPYSLFPLYNPSSNVAQVRELNTIAKQLVSVLYTLGDYPYIRFYDPQNNGTSIPAKLAEAVQHELDELCRVDPDFPPESPHKRAILVIVDRTLDLVSPLVHEFTYQAMMNDLLVLEGGKYIYKAEGGATTESQAVAQTSATLDEGDPIWMLIRHWHYADAVDYIRNAFTKFLGENKAAGSALAKENAGDMAEGAGGIDALKKMKDTLSALPQFQDLKAKFSTHINICQECKAMFERRQLDLVAAVEQDLATGETADGRSVKFTQVMMDMVPALDSDSVTNVDKLRLLMLYIIAQNGIEDDERRRLLGYARLTLEESQAITNLNYLAVRLTKSKEKKIMDERGKYTYHAHNKVKKQKSKSNDDMPYDLSRWTPILKTIMNDQIRNTLDLNLFPWIKEPPAEEIAPPPPRTQPSSTKISAGKEKANAVVPPDSNYPYSLRTTRPSWAKKKTSPKSGKDADVSDIAALGSPAAQSSDLRKNGPRIIVFSVGGLTFSELRATYEVIRDMQRDVIVGSTHIYNPPQFVDVVKNLNTGQMKEVETKGAVGASSPVDASVSGMTRSGTSTSITSQNVKERSGLRGMFGKKVKDRRISEA